MTLADLLVAPQMEFLARTPEWTTLTVDKPDLIAWLSRIETRASMQATTWDRVIELARAARASDDNGSQAGKAPASSKRV